MSPWDCLANPGQCNEMLNTNDYGYPAHFDLQDANLQVRILDVFGLQRNEMMLSA
jgi:hypothetical protein